MAEVVSGVKVNVFGNWLRFARRNSHLNDSSRIYQVKFRAFTGLCVVDLKEEGMLHMYDREMRYQLASNTETLMLSDDFERICSCMKTL